MRTAQRLDWLGEDFNQPIRRGQSDAEEDIVTGAESEVKREKQVTGERR